VISGSRPYGVEPSAPAGSRSARAGADAVRSGGQRFMDQFGCFQTDTKHIGTPRDCPQRLRKFTVAIGAFDAVGPGLTGVQDATEAIWSNKHHVWVQELGG
jgi:hypothetical protein